MWSHVFECPKFLAHGSQWRPWWRRDCHHHWVGDSCPWTTGRAPLIPSCRQMLDYSGVFPLQPNPWTNNTHAIVCRADIHQGSSTDSHPTPTTQFCETVELRKDLQWKSWADVRPVEISSENAIIWYLFDPSSLQGPIRWIHEDVIHLENRVLQSLIRCQIWRSILQRKDHTYISLWLRLCEESRTAQHVFTSGLSGHTWQGWERNLV